MIHQLEQPAEAEEVQRRLSLLLGLGVLLSSCGGSPVSPANVAVPVTTADVPETSAAGDEVRQDAPSTTARSADTSDNSRVESSTAVTLTTTPSSDVTVRVPIEDLLDFDLPLPENAGAIGLGDIAPPSDLTFCEAFGLAPARWLDDAWIPLQVWIDAYAAGRPSVVSSARAPLDRLAEFAQNRMDWHFKRQPARPAFTIELAADARAVADAAAAECSDLPLVAGLPGWSDTPENWAELSVEEVLLRCGTELADVNEGIAWYRTEFGATPTHQQQIETANLETYLRLYEAQGGYPDGFFNYFASDFAGVGPDGFAMPVPGGACDR